MNPVRAKNHVGADCLSVLQCQCALGRIAGHHLTSELDLHRLSDTLSNGYPFQLLMQIDSVTIISALMYCEIHLAAS